MAHTAQDTFVADIDGVPTVIQKGQVFPSSHAAVKLDDGRGLLFKPLDMDGDDEEPAKARRGRPRKVTMDATGGDVTVTDTAAGKDDE